MLGCALALAALGVMFVASATGGAREGLAGRQAIWVAVGLGAMIAAILFDYRMLLKFSFAIYCVSLLPLVYLLVFGERIANVRSWIRVGRFQFQPAELAKIATALLVAYLFENEDDARLHASTFVKLGAIVGIPALLVFLQPDLGLALTFLPLVFVGLYFGGLPAKGWVVIGVIVVMLAGGRLVPAQGLPEGANRDVLEPGPGRAGRGLPGAPVQDRGGIGRVLRQGLPHRHAEPAALPSRQHTDFILAVIAEEWGFLGVILVLGLFAA